LKKEKKKIPKEREREREKEMRNKKKRKKSSRASLTHKEDGTSAHHQKNNSLRQRVINVI